MKIDVSIIVPCYNVATYVDACMESLTKQTFKNLEIICIDDGSTDETRERLLQWKEKDPRIVLLEQANGGVSAARNAGLNEARGLYVGFVDPDDYVDAQMYSLLFSAARQYDADVVECGNHVFSDTTHELIPAKRRSPERSFEPDAAPDNFFRNSVWGKMDICVWNKLFRRSMLEEHHLRFETALKYGAEDETFRLMAIPHARRLAFIPDCLYYYRHLRANSISRHCDGMSHMKCQREFQRLQSILKYWKEQQWSTSGLFRYGVRKLKHFFMAKHSLFGRATQLRKQDMLQWWREFYQRAEGHKHLHILSERDQAFVNLLTREAQPANMLNKLLVMAGTCLPGQKGRYYVFKRDLSGEFMPPDATNSQQREPHGKTSPDKPPAL